jgi:hypothetical protein
MSADDDIDWGGLGLRPELAAKAVALHPKPKGLIRRSVGRFTKFPHVWEDCLGTCSHICTYRVAHYLLRRYWETHNERIKLPSKGLGLRGVDRRRKRIALQELEALGLILVERRGRRSPIVRLLCVD